MHEDDFPPGWQNEVWLAREIRAVKPIPVAASMNKAPYQHLWLGIL
jgi:hypothetical protein